MSEEKNNIKNVLMGEQFMTICGKGYVQINLDDFPELFDKDEYGINDWINQNAGDLFITDDAFITKEDTGRTLWEHHSESPVEWDKFKCEESYFVYED